MHLSRYVVKCTVKDSPFNIQARRFKSPRREGTGIARK